MRFAILASGSSGNATVVEATGTAILIDCGLSIRRLDQRAKSIGFDLSQLKALAVTHEHGDHIGGAAALARRYEIPIYMTHGTRIASSLGEERGLEIREISPHEPFHIDSLTIRPSPVPHDAKEPCQFVVECDDARLGILTDLGSDTRHIRRHFSACCALVLEFNHDRQLLDESEYPNSVKARIAGRLGHFSNEQAECLLKTLLSKRLRCVVAAHISQRANDDDLVEKILQSMFDDTDINWTLAHQDRVTHWIRV